MSFRAQPLVRVFTLSVEVLLALQVLTVLSSWLQFTPESSSILGEMARTVLPDYLGTTLWLCALARLKGLVTNMAWCFPTSKAGASTSTWRAVPWPAIRRTPPTR